MPHLSNSFQNLLTQLSGLVSVLYFPGERDLKTEIRASFSTLHFKVKGGLLRWSAEKPLSLSILIQYSFSSYSSKCNGVVHAHMAQGFPRLILLELSSIFQLHYFSKLLIYNIFSDAILYQCDIHTSSVLLALPLSSNCLSMILVSWSLRLGSSIKVKLSWGTALTLLTFLLPGS